MNRHALTLLLVPALALSACGKSETTVASDGEGNKVSVVKDGAGDTNPDIKITTADGEMTIKTGDQNSPLPLGLALPPGSKVLSNMSASSPDGKGSGGIVAFETDAKPADVAAFYKQQAGAKGMKIEAEMTTGETVSITAKGTDESGFNVTAQPAGAKTAVTIYAGKGT